MSTARDDGGNGRGWTWAPGPTPPTLNEMFPEDKEAQHLFLGLHQRFMAEVEIMRGQITQNLSYTRSAYTEGIQGRERNVDQEAGYPDTYGLTADSFRALFDRDPIAARVVELYPKQCWKVLPSIFEDEDIDNETEFELAIGVLGKDLQENSWLQDEDNSVLWEHLYKADVLSGIGHFGVMLLGIDDGRNLDEPVDGIVAIPPEGHPQTPRGKDRGPGSGVFGTDLQYDAQPGLPGRQAGNVGPQGFGGTGARAFSSGSRKVGSDGYIHRSQLNMHSRFPVMPDCLMTEAEEKALAELPDYDPDKGGYARGEYPGLTTNERAKIKQWAGSRDAIVTNARDATEKAQEQGKKGPYSGTGDTGWAPYGIPYSMDSQYMSGAFGSYARPAGSSLAGTDAQYFGVQFGPSETFQRPEDREAEEGEDGKKEKKPRRRLLFLREYDESLVQVVRYEWNIRNPRFGQPVMYRITLNDPREQHTGVGLPLATVFVHWSRIVHLADHHEQAGTSPVFAPPRMRPVYNRLLDLYKLYGGSAEMFWRAAFPGFSLETHPQLGGDVNLPAASVVESKMKTYFTGLQRWMMWAGISVKPLAPQVSDPSSHIDKQLEAICIKMGCPKRIFMGSERGELGSSQDDEAWNENIQHRQKAYLTPRVIGPFIDRLILVGVLPVPEQYHVVWPDLEAISEAEKAGIGLTTTQAIAAFVGGNCEAAMTLPRWYETVLGLPRADVRQIVQEVTDQSVVAQQEAATGEQLEGGRFTPDPAGAQGQGPPGQEGGEPAEPQLYDEDGRPISKKSEFQPGGIPKVTYATPDGEPVEDGATLYDESGNSVEADENGEYHAQPVVVGPGQPQPPGQEQVGGFQPGGREQAAGGPDAKGGGRGAPATKASGQVPVGKQQDEESDEEEGEEGEAEDGEAGDEGGEEATGKDDFRPRRIGSQPQHHDHVSPEDMDDQDGDKDSREGKKGPRADVPAGKRNAGKAPAPPGTKAEEGEAVEPEIDEETEANPSSKKVPPQFKKRWKR